MKPSQLMAEIVSRLSAASDLAPFLPILAEDNVTNFEEQIQTGSEKNGAVLVVGDVDGVEADASTQSLRSALTSTISVYVFQGANSQQALKGMALNEAVVSAIRAGNTGGAVASLSKIERMSTEAGEILSVLQFSVPTQL